jgi:hypothetical protein
MGNGKWNSPTMNKANPRPQIQNTIAGMELSADRTKSRRTETEDRMKTNAARGPSSRRRRHEEKPRLEPHGWKNESGEQTEQMGNRVPTEHEAKSVALENLCRSQNHSRIKRQGKYKALGFGLKEEHTEHRQIYRQHKR